MLEWPGKRFLGVGGFSRRNNPLEAKLVSTVSTDDQPFEDNLKHTIDGIHPAKDGTIRASFVWSMEMKRSMCEWNAHDQLQGAVSRLVEPWPKPLILRGSQRLAARSGQGFEPIGKRHRN